MRILQNKLKKKSAKKKLAVHDKKFPKQEEILGKNMLI